MAAEMENQKIKKDCDKAMLIVEEDETLDGKIDMNMLIHNRVTGFLPMQVRYVDDRIEYCYTIQGMVSLKTMLEANKADYSLQYAIYSAIRKAVISGKEYFLSENNYVLDPSYLYWNQWREQLGICYCPGWNQDVSVQMIHLTEYFMKYTCHEKKENVEFIYGIYELLQEEGFVLESLESYLVQQSRDSLCENASNETDGRRKRETKKSKKSREIWCLKKNSGYAELPESLMLKTGEITIGRQENSDILFPVAEISRNHAKLLIGDRIYVEDCGSTNGTRINGNIISAKGQALCKKGDILSFANISYRMDGINELSE